MASVTLAQANTILEAATVASRSGPARRVVISVPGAGGHPVALAREMAGRR